MRIVCQQTILMQYHALFVVVFFKKSGKICNCRQLQIVGGALRVNNPEKESCVSRQNRDFI